MDNYRGKILLIDDDAVFSGVFGKELVRMGFKVEQGYGADIMRTVGKNDFDIVILDIVMPKISGLDLLKNIRKYHPLLDVIMLTGNATIENAIGSMKAGAFDYFTKPVALDRVEQVLARCMDIRYLKAKNAMLKNKVSDLREGHFIGNSPSIIEIKSLINRFAVSDSTVLIRGESGTGKELIANLIHMNSSRRDEPFIIVDCTALKESLLESELYGHERGAFTGAVTKKHGIFEIADGGTVFLDEIGDISPALQAKLLRVVETKSFRRLGGTERITVDVRLVAATNRNLLEMVEKSEFREDLYYRINVINITLPALRDLKEDIELLANHFLSEFSNVGDVPKQFSPDTLQMFKEYSWPGNARELKNIIERAILLSDGNTIEVTDVPLKPSLLPNLLKNHLEKSDPSLNEIGQLYIKWILKKTKGNKQLAARILKIDRKTIARKLDQTASEE